MTTFTDLELQERLEASTVNLYRAYRGAADAAEAVIRAKANLATNENFLLLQGVEGKNEAERKARLADATMSDRLTLERAEEAHRKAQLDVTIAQLDHELVRDLLQLHLKGGVDAAT